MGEGHHDSRLVIAELRFRDPQFLADGRDLRGVAVSQSFQAIQDGPRPVVGRLEGSGTSSCLPAARRVPRTSSAIPSEGGAVADDKNVAPMSGDLRLIRRKVGQALRERSDVIGKRADVPAGGYCSSAWFFLRMFSRCSSASTSASVSTAGLPEAMAFTSA